LPTELNPLNIRIAQDITNFLIQVHHALGILEGMTKYIPNVERSLELKICSDSYYSRRSISLHFQKRQIRC